MKILFIGNSFTNVGADPDGWYTTWPSTPAGRRPTCTNVAVNSNTLQWHTTNPGTLAAIDQGGWDYVVLQEYSTRPTDSAGPTPTRPSSSTT